MRGHAEALALIEEHELRLAAHHIKAAAREPVPHHPSDEETDTEHKRNLLQELTALTVAEGVDELAACLSHVVADDVWQAGTAELEAAEVQAHSERQAPAASMPAMQLALTDADFELAE
eukprot:m.195916 g.195916  ORF g.195916 m.195916 type:complete len:119 (-) comp53732_c1_seq21:243-599(-)